MRSIPKEQLVPLARVEGIQWVCLAKEEWSDTLKDSGWINGLEGCEDWLDTAQALSGLDLIITVDTAIAHLAGGLGKRVWILLAAVPDMRWMLHRTDSPWYTSATLYRQSVAGEWGPVLEKVASDLQREVHASRFQEAA